MNMLLSQFNTVHTPKGYFFQMHINIIIRSPFGSPNSRFPIQFPPKFVFLLPQSDMYAQSTVARLN